MTECSRASHVILMTLLAGATLCLSGSSVAVAEKPPQEWDGLVRRESKSLEHVYVRPNVEFKAYKSVRLDPVQVAMDKNWDPNEGKTGLAADHVSSADIQRIREELSKLFRSVFAERLSKGGYPLVETNGDNVLLVQAALINVDITAPQNPTGYTRSYVMNTGRMTLVMQLIDSVTGQTLARVVDTKQGSSNAAVQWNDSVTNSSTAQRLIGQWADALRKALDEVNGRSAGK